VGQQLLSVAGEEVDLARQHVPGDDATDPDHVELPLDDDLREEHVVPGAVHELADIEILHSRLGRPQSAQQVRRVERVEPLPDEQMMWRVGHLIGERLALIPGDLIPSRGDLTADWGAVETAPRQV